MDDKGHHKNNMTVTPARQVSKEMEQFDGQRGNEPEPARSDLLWPIQGHPHLHHVTPRRRILLPTLSLSTEQDTTMSNVPFDTVLCQDEQMDRLAPDRALPVLPALDESFAADANSLPPLQLKPRQHRSRRASCLERHYFLQPHAATAPSYSPPPPATRKISFDSDEVEKLSDGATRTAPTIQSSAKFTLRMKEDPNTNPFAEPPIGSSVQWFLDNGPSHRVSKENCPYFSEDSNENVPTTPMPTSDEFAAVASPPKCRKQIIFVDQMITTHAPLFPQI